MISPELLRCYPFFSRLNDKQLRAIAVFSCEVSYAQGECLFETDQESRALFFLIEGDIDLQYIVTDRENPNLRTVFWIGRVNPGEPFGISALIEPYRYTATAIANSLCRVIEIGASALRSLCEDDIEVAAILMRHTAQAAMSRLRDRGVQLVGVRS